MTDNTPTPCLPSQADNAAKELKLGRVITTEQEQSIADHPLCTFSGEVNRITVEGQEFAPVDERLEFEDGSAIVCKTINQERKWSFGIHKTHLEKSEHNNRFKNFWPLCDGKNADYLVDPLIGDPVTGELNAEEEQEMAKAMGWDKPTRKTPPRCRDGINTLADHFADANLTPQELVLTSALEQLQKECSDVEENPAGSDIRYEFPDGSAIVTRNSRGREFAPIWGMGVHREWVKKGNNFDFPLMHGNKFHLTQPPRLPEPEPQPWFKQLIDENDLNFEDSIRSEAKRAATLEPAKAAAQEVAEAFASIERAANHSEMAACMVDSALSSARTCLSEQDPHRRRDLAFEAVDYVDAAHEAHKRFAEHLQKVIFGLVGRYTLPKER